MGGEMISERQIKFAELLGLLLGYAKLNDIRLKIACLYRTPEEQKKMVDEGKSKTMNSKHLTGTAVDIVIFKNGQPNWDTEAYRPLGIYWESLGGIWGGSWKFKDSVHFQIGDDI